MIFCLFAGYAYAQPAVFGFDNIPLSEALVSVSEKTNTQIAFDASQLGSVIIKKDIEAGDRETVLSLLLEGTGYRYELLHGCYLIIPETEVISSQSSEGSRLAEGILYDGGSSRPVPWASIYLPEKKTLLQSSEKGTFRFEDPGGDALHMIISHISYFPVDTIFVPGSANPRIEVRLQRKNIPIDTVNIARDKSRMLEIGREAGHSTIKPARFVYLPNFGETDIFSSLGLLPGISYSQNSSDLIIRGGYGDQNLVLFDGFTLYNLDHFFGSFSSLNPNVIKDVQIYKGGYGSEYGERVSGIIDITGKTGDLLAPVICGGVNFLSSNLTAEIPVTAKLHMVAGARIGYSSIFSNFLIENLYEEPDGGQSGPMPDGSNTVVTPVYNFHDLNIKLNYTLNEREQISISAYGGNDLLEISDFSERPNMVSDLFDQNRWGNYGFGASWINEWNDKLVTALQAGSSGYRNRYYTHAEMIQDIISGTTVPGSGPGSLDFEETEENNLSDNYVSMRNSYLINNRHHLEFGTSVRRNEINYHNDALHAYIEDDSLRSSWLSALYVQDEVIPFEGLSVKPGIRLNYYQGSNKYFLEPRLSASYTTPSGIGFKIAAGRYYQYLTKVSSDQSYGYNRDFWVLSDQADHPVLSSNHLIAGTKFGQGQLSVDIEAWYKTYSGLQKLLYISEFTGSTPPTGNPPQKPIQEYINTYNTLLTGHGRSYGIDILFSYEKQHYSGWLSWSFGRAIQNFESINRGMDIPAPYDQPWSLDWTNMYTLGNWNFSSLYVFATGQPYIAFSVNNENLETGRLYKRMPNYHRFDISANYTFRIGAVSFKAGASIINLFNRKNYHDIDSRRFIFGNTSLEETSIIKSQGITPNVYLHFRF